MNNLFEKIEKERPSSHCGSLSAACGAAYAGRQMLLRAALFALLILTMVATSPAAFAQAAGNTGKNGQGDVGQPDADASPAGQRGLGSVPGYFQRFPFAAAAYQADTMTQSQAGPMQSNAGSTQAQVAYQFVLKLCDDGYGIAYMQLPMVAMDTPAAARDSELFQNLMTTFGYPMSDSQFQIIQRENNQRLLELAFDPERVMWATSSAGQTTSSQISKSMANTGEIALETVFNYIVYGDSGNGALINVANEGAVAGLTYRGNGDDISVAQAVYMVQTMYKLVFIPMAVLFLLPGAVISQAKAMASKGFGLQGPEQQSPFDGILRSIVAVFLIPGTQVIVSWAIDTGNSLAYSCKPWVDLPTIFSWTEQLCYGPQQQINSIQPPNPGGNQSSGGGAGGALGSLGGQIGGMLGGSFGAQIGAFLGGLLGSALGGYAGTADGLAANQSETQSIIEQQDWAGQLLQSSLNGATLMTAITLIILTATQVVTMCYLLLLGPIAAAFYAWPQVTNTHLFRGVFGKWVDGVIKIAMWRFIWMVVLAIMTQRIIYMAGAQLDLKWECAVFLCLMGIMCGAPSSPFTFQPFSAFQTVRQVATQSQSNSMFGPGSQPSSSPGSGGPQGASGASGTPTSVGGSSTSGTPGQPGENSATSSPSTGSPGDGNSSPSTAGGTGSDTKDAPAPPPGSANPDAGHTPPAGGGSPPAGPPPMTHGGGGGSSDPGVPGGSGTGQPGGANSGGLPNTGGGSAAGGGASGGGQGNNNTTVNVNASAPQMPSNGPPTGLTPPANASPSNPAVSTNPGAPATVQAAPGAAAAGGGSGGGGGGSDDKAAGAKNPSQHGAPAGAPDASSAIGQISSAMGGASAPPPAKNDEK